MSNLIFATLRTLYSISCIFLWGNFLILNWIFSVLFPINCMQQTELKLQMTIMAIMTFRAVRCLLTKKDISQISLQSGLRMTRKL